MEPTIAILVMLVALAFALGAASAFIFTKVFMVSRAPANEIDEDLHSALVGVWFEHIPQSRGHSVTIGNLYFDKSRGILAFDGTNYNDDLSPFCYFETVASSVDMKNNAFHYMFNSKLHGELEKNYAGYGTVNFQRVNNSFEINDAHYISASVDGSPMSHTMNRISVLQHENSYKRVFSKQELKTLMKLAEDEFDLEIEFDLPRKEEKIAQLH